MRGLVVEIVMERQIEHTAYHFTAR